MRPNVLLRLLSARPGLWFVPASAALAGCLVSFDDYPVGPIGGLSSAGTSGGTGGSGGTDGGKSGKGGKDGSGGSIVSVGGGGSGGASGGTGGGSGGIDPGEGGGGGTDVLPTEELIDDFEDGDDQLLEVGDRHGNWYTDNDGTGTQTPAEGDVVEPELLDPPREGSMYALHMSGSGFGGVGSWGALIRANLVDNGTINGFYDVSGYTGITFWIRSADGLTHNGRVTLPAANTAIQCTNCGDHFGEDITYTADWQKFTLPFADMEQVGWGSARTELDLDSVIAIQFSFEEGNDFDVWIDDVAFY